MSDPLILIPARLGATRLPNKPLADIAGEPMIVHVWRRAVEAGIGPVAVATDAPAIAEAVTRAGGRAVMTRADTPPAPIASPRPWRPSTRKVGTTWS
jgi:3-deoxy-manno-octulosonate cytidylyltransferase (CMP-KDO synthetase)